MDFKYRENIARVVMTGLGPLASAGKSKNLFWQGLVNSDTGLMQEEFKIDNNLVKRFYIHKIKGFNINDYGIGKDKLLEIEEWKENNVVFDLYYALAAIKLALDDSNLTYDCDSNDIGLVVSAESPGAGNFYMEMIDKGYEFIKHNNGAGKIDFLNHFYQNFAKTGYDQQTFMFLFHIAKVFNVHGFSLYVNNACASGLYALETASQMIKTGRCSAVVVAASEHPDGFKHMWFEALNMYATDGKIKPFDKNANGLVFGEGGAAVILESLEHALKRKAHIYAEYSGGGFSGEAWKVSVPAVGNNFYEKCLKDALRQSSLDPRDIDLINPHGVGTNISDRYEAKTIANVFDEKEMPMITALKPYFGHTLGASALLELIGLILCMENNTVLPTLNCNEIDAKLKIGLVRKSTNKKLKNAIKMSCGFAGNDGCVVLRKITSN